MITVVETRSEAGTRRKPEVDPKVVRVFIVDDHDLVREGLTSILGREVGIEVVGQAESAEEALEALPGVDPDVVLIDYRLPGMNGVHLCREIAERRIRGRVVLLSAYLDESIVEAALLAGATGYVVKDVEADELRRGIRAVARGETVVDPKIAGRILGWAARLDPRLAGGLNPAEARILRLLAGGGSNTDIARTAGLSTYTVKSYLSSIYRKLGATGRAEATAIAIRRGLV